MHKLTIGISFHLLVVTGLSNLSFAGGISSSGGEFITVEQNPWYLGDQPVSYCVSQSENFSNPRASEIVEGALNIWTKTIRHLQPQDISKPVAHKNMTLKFQRTNCPNAELEFKFGIHSQDIVENLAHHAKHTAAFAWLKEYDEIKGRATKGIIWLAADSGPNSYQGKIGENLFWNRESTLKAVLLHEIGHIFGMQHAACRLWLNASGISCTNHCPPNNIYDVSRSLVLRARKLAASRGGTMS